MRTKHRKDYNNGKNGCVGGNPRYADKGAGFLKKPTAINSRRVAKKEVSHFEREFA